MRGWTLLVLISFLMYGVMTMNGFDGGIGNLPEEGSTEEEIVTMSDDYRAKIWGYLASDVTVFQPDVSKDEVSGAENGIEADEFFPDCKECGGAGFHFDYDKTEGVQIFASWYSIGYYLKPKMGETPEWYDCYGKPWEGLAWYMTLADLDKDGTPELIVALHDGVVDGILKVFKLYNYIDLDGQKQQTLRDEEVGEFGFQNEVYIEKNGHIIVKYGSQGLYKEYKMENGKLKKIYDPNMN